MWRPSRRRFLERLAVSAGGAVAAAFARQLPAAPHEGIPTGERAVRHPSIEVLNPRDRAPASFIIDDSTCLVNMGHFCMPQFHAAMPDRSDYQKPWHTWPREIPDAFVREFGEWCAEQGVRGKYSVVPYPACVGWLDRDLPGWPRRKLTESLDLVRTLMAPGWDIHPEMITHTRVIDLKTGRPFQEISAATMENSYPRQQKSVDELSAYLAYALQILKNCELSCEGVTTPGGFGNLVKPELSAAVQEALRDVYSVEIPHYFKYIVAEDESSQPQLEHVRGLGTDDVRVTVNVVAGTGDWFGGWDGDLESEPDRYATRDGQSGRMVHWIRKGQPAVFLCHWPGMYCHGTKSGFRAFQQVVTSINEHHADAIAWMKPSEIARYWAARELTHMERANGEIAFAAPFACPDFTLRLASSGAQPPRLSAAGTETLLREVADRRLLTAGTWMREGVNSVVCLDLPKGSSLLRV